MKPYILLFFVSLLGACAWTPKPSRACVATFGPASCQWSIDQSWRGM